MFPDAVMELGSLPAPAAVPELIKPKRGLQVGVLLRPADPGGGPLRHLHDLHLEVPVAPGHAVCCSSSAVELSPGHVESVIRDVELGSSVMQGNIANLGCQHSTQEPCNI